VYGVKKHHVYRILPVPNGQRTPESQAIGFYRFALGPVIWLIGVRRGKTTLIHVLIVVFLNLLICIAGEI